MNRCGKAKNSNDGQGCAHVPNYHRLRKPSLPGRSVSQRQSDLLEMMLVVCSDLVELGLQRSNARLTVDELAVAICVVVQTSLVNDAIADAVVDPPGNIERHPCIVEALCPRVLVERPEHLSRFADDTADAIEQNGLGVGKVMQDEPDRPFAWSIGSGELLIVQIKAPQRLTSRRFEPCNNVHFDPFQVYSILW